MEHLIEKLTIEQKELLTYLVRNYTENVNVNDLKYDILYKGNIEQDLNILSTITLKYLEDYERIINFSLFKYYGITEDNYLDYQFNDKALQLLLKKMPLLLNSTSELTDYLKNNEGWHKEVGFINGDLPGKPDEIGEIFYTLEDFKNLKSLQLQLPLKTFGSERSSLAYTCFFFQEQFHLFTNIKSEKFNHNRHYSFSNFSHVENIIIRDIHLSGDSDYYDKYWISEHLKTAILI